MDERVSKFLQSQSFAVAGASPDRSKYGNKVLRCYLEHGRKVVPVHPKAESVEGIPAVRSVSDLPAEIGGLSIVTPPQVTEKIVREAIDHGIANIWMQPGAESDEAVRICKEAGINVIGDGTCLLQTWGCD
jgi:predicted CoA-binding protein